MSRLVQQSLYSPERVRPVYSELGPDEFHDPVDMWENAAERIKDKDPFGTRAYNCLLEVLSLSKRRKMREAVHEGRKA